MKTKFFSSLACSCFAALTSLLLLEICLRVLPIDMTIISQVSSFDSKALPSRQKISFTTSMFYPGKSGSHQTSEFKYEFKLNSDGIRDENIPVEKSADVFRILMIGPSWVFGWGVESEHSVPAQLGKFLAQRYGKRVEVINAGVPTQWILKNLLFYLRTTHKYRPDMIIHMQSQDFGFQIIEDLNEIFWDSTLTTTVDKFFVKIYRTLVSIPLIGKAYLPYFTLERLRRASIIREKLADYLSTDVVPLSTKEVVRFLSEQIDPSANFNTTRLFEVIGDLQLALATKITAGVPLESLIGHTTLKDRDSQFVFDSTGQILKIFGEELAKNKIDYMYYNMGGHPFLEGSSAGLDELTHELSLRSLEISGLSYVSFNEYLFKNCKWPYGSNKIKELFYMIDTHPNRSGYLSLTKVLYTRLIKKLDSKLIIDNVDFQIEPICEEYREESSRS